MSAIYEGGFNAYRKRQHKTNEVHYRGDTICGGGKDKNMGIAVGVGMSDIVHQIG